MDLIESLKNKLETIISGYEIFNIKICLIDWSVH